MKTSNNNRNIRIRQLVIRFLALALLLFGLWFTGTNLQKFIQGYSLSAQTSKQYIADTLSREELAVTQKSKVTLPSERYEASAYEWSTLVQRIKETAKTELYPERPEFGEEIGELYIPKLDVVLPIYHGTSEDELERGIGHFADSVLPGEKDNTVLSGHRDTVFRKLGEVGEGDLLIVRTMAGEFEYKVSKVRIVDEDDRTVIVPKPRATLTVSTCYPFDFIGSAPDRYILVAYLASKTLY